MGGNRAGCRAADSSEPSADGSVPTAALSDSDDSGIALQNTFPFKALARFADNLYRARELTGLDQREAARRAALTRAKLDKIEGGEHVPSLDVLIRIAGAYSTSVGDLVSGVTWRPGWVEHSGAS